MSNHQSKSSRLLVQYLADNHVRCPFCGYCLHGAAGNRCPECGRAFRLGLILQSAFDGWWAASLFGTSLTALLSMVLLAFALFSDRRGMGHIIAFVSLVVYGAGSGAFAAALLGLRRRWADCPSRWRIIITIIAISSPLLVPLTMYILYLIG